MIAPPRWKPAELELARQRSIELFREERLREPLEFYLRAFDEVRKAVETLLDRTEDLSRLDEQAADLLTDAGLLEAVRYLAGPPVSNDDLKVLAEASLSPSRLKADTAMARRIVETVRLALDRRRFPWVEEGRSPTESERGAAVLASAALMAMRRTETVRRHEGKNTQEDLVEQTLVRGGLGKVESRTIETLTQAPGTGEFCRESHLGNRKADFVVGLWDTRVLAIECKVSNSATNSVKRLNNDAAAKAEVWRRDFGTRQVVPGAVLSGVYKLHNLEDAQRRGLTLFWAHELQALIDWIEATRTP